MRTSAPMPPRAAAKVAERLDLLDSRGGKLIVHAPKSGVDSGHYKVDFDPPEAFSLVVFFDGTSTDEFDYIDAVMYHGVTYEDLDSHHLTCGLFHFRPDPSKVSFDMVEGERIY